MYNLVRPAGSLTRTPPASRRSNCFWIPYKFVLKNLVISRAYPFSLAKIKIKTLSAFFEPRIGSIIGTMTYDHYCWSYDQYNWYYFIKQQFGLVLVYNISMHRIYYGDNLPILQSLPSTSIDLIYIDPPFNTGRTQARTQIKTEHSEQGDRVGFKGRRYETTRIGAKAYRDIFDDYLAFLQPRMEEAHRLLQPHGSLYFHIDYREVHYCKMLLDSIFGRECFLNEIIWAYDFGGRPKNRWPSKHDNILWYAKDAGNYIFNYDEIERIPYMSPGLVGPEKAARGKLPTDTWWHTIVATSGKEKTGYPTQKPRGVIDRIITASSRPGDLVLDFFAGSGTVGESCLAHGRRFFLVDNNLQAMEVMAQRFQGVENIEWIGYDPTHNHLP